MGILNLISSGVAYAAYIFASYLIVVSCYRLFFHPLRKYPGPLFAKLSDGYAGFFAVLKCLHLVTRDNLLKYGPVVRLGPNKLVFNSSKALHDIYDNERVVKAGNYAVTMQAPNVYNILNVTDREQHRIKRKLIGQAITERAMRNFEPTMMKQIDIFIGQILSSSRAPETQPVNITEYTRRLGIDVVSLLAFGHALNTQTDPNYRFVLDGINASTYFQNNQMQFPLLKQLRLNFLLAMIGSVRQRRIRYRAMLERMIADRIAEGKNIKHDLYSIVTDQLGSDAPGGLQASGLWSEAVFFLPAGGDTTATTISALFFYLSRNPKSYMKLAREIRDTFTSSLEIKGGPQLAGCSYLRACIDEALRLCPPVPGTLWRELSKTDDGTKPFIVDGHIIPRGTYVGVSAYALHHNEEYFPDPFAYKPERWLSSETPEAQRKAARDAFASFSIGYRGCAGKAMAYLESSLVMAKTLWYFDFEMAPGELGKAGAGCRGRTDKRDREDEFQLYDIFGSSHDGPNLVFQTRDTCKELSGSGL
ncbi:cytochrome P450 [Hypoxylon sp. FL1857]|nr:cytochrome P450 [Hypoxylon sp. FL1857]